MAEKEGFALACGQGSTAVENCHRQFSKSRLFESLTEFFG
jgi:hypothetical protein